ncbi:hypothetical protein FOZ63_022327 [Perkinsus olseni]|uniref:DUF676 domain-containing protein n=1 Tax=Perkinsus olseni TaxID=32597 RepID=A0A7J6TGW7_PEROL|nr:hypothetical protein FOZ63_022327 [Perkinsus olseni]
MSNLVDSSAIAGELVQGHDGFLYQIELQQAKHHSEHYGELSYKLNRLSTIAQLAKTLVAQSIWSSRYVPVIFDEAHFSSVQILICAALSDFRFRLPPPQTGEVSESTSDAISEGGEERSRNVGTASVPPCAPLAEPKTLEEFLKLKMTTDTNPEESSVPSPKTCAGSTAYMDAMERAYSHLESFFCEVTKRCLDGRYEKSLAEKLSIPHKPPEGAGPKNVIEIMATMNVLAVSSFELWHRLLDVLPLCCREVCERLRRVWERKTIEKFSHCNSCVTQTVDSSRDLAFPLEDDIWEAHKAAADRVRETFFFNPPKPLCLIEDTTKLAIPVKEGEPPAPGHHYTGMSAMPIIFEQKYSNGASSPRSGDASEGPTEQRKPMATDPKPYRGAHLIVLVHGFQGSSYDMRLFKDNLACVFPDSLFLCSSCNEEDTEGNIAEMGQRLADEVACYIADWCPGSALMEIDVMKHSFDCSVLKRWRKSECLHQLTMADSDIPEECYLYRLAKESGQILPQFQHVVLASSCQDQYAGFDSARIEVSDKARQEPTMGSVYTEMARSLVSGIAPEKLIRLDVNFYLPERSLDSLIGRAAHIQFIENQPLMKMIIHNYCFLFQ